MANVWSCAYGLLNQAHYWKDALFQRFAQGLEVLVHVYPSIMHITKIAIMMYTFSLLLYGLLLSWHRNSTELPKPAVGKTKEKTKTKRVKLALPLAPFVMFHMTLKTKKEDRVLKIGVSWGPIKAMAVMALGGGWTKSIKPQIKLYGSALLAKGSMTVC